MISQDFGTEMRTAYAHMLMPEPQILMAELAVRNRVTVKDLKGPDRSRPLVHIRQDIMRQIHETGEISLAAVGRMFNRDHSTVINAIRRSKERDNG